MLASTSLVEILEVAYHGQDDVRREYDGVSRAPQCVVMADPYLRGTLPFHRIIADWRERGRG